ncbi:YrrS family protein [Fictibacillus sp. 23RED33]|jgi:cell division protein FtsN|uniref:YrrS family protein n=1 Tax=unclassified Fictibacillus TaxID=2644029 RepID=UPI0018CCD121|nr:MULTISPECIES: YrrS family protein [unclassified Fictibacillus]MBH0159991.1 YrrS family protein [Fictibacillus sp. 26RED30]MBH0174767.1 YrrS family protein [Fictibacillus sp. 23RED33]
MKRNQRYESRLEKRKQNRFLNIAIGLVVLLIVVVAFNLFSGDDNETASTNKSNSEETTENNESNNRSIEMETDDSKSKANDEDSESQDKEESAEDKDKADEEATEEEKTESETPEGGGPEGPWQPIGTSQTEPHTKTYDDGSQDWNEMVQALSYATSIPQDQMTIFWLGNGGGPDLSKGTVQSKADGKKYDVMLQWIPEKGWQPTSVTPVQ